MILLFFVGCFSAGSEKLREKRRPFDEAEYHFVRMNGTSSIRGKILKPTRSGEKKPCSGCEITLNPATSYSEVFYIKTVQNGIPIEEPDLRVLKYIRKAVADDSGKFEYKNIAAGKYYIYSPIVYEVPKPGGGYTKTNGFLYKSIYIRKDENVDIILTR